MSRSRVITEIGQAFAASLAAANPPLRYMEALPEPEPRHWGRWGIWSLEAIGLAWILFTLGRFVLA